MSVAAIGVPSLPPFSDNVTVIVAVKSPAVGYACVSSTSKAPSGMVTVNVSVFGVVLALSPEPPAVSRVLGSVFSVNATVKVPSPGSAVTVPSNVFVFSLGVTVILLAIVAVLRS